MQMATSIFQGGLCGYACVSKLTYSHYHPKGRGLHHNKIKGVTLAIFLYCCSDCPFNAVQMDQATWAVLAAIKKFSPCIIHYLLDNLTRIRYCCQDCSSCPSNAIQMGWTSMSTTRRRSLTFTNRC